MREIKFRFWNILGKEMEYRDLYFFEEEGMSTIPCQDPTYYETMQYIGLKDCKGTEIYEGDIVSGVRADGSVVVYWKGIVKFGKVDIGSNGFEYNCWINGFYAETINDGSPSEYLTEDMIKGNTIIIGNIYEHPELAVREPDD